MALTYRIVFGDACDMREVADESIHLVVTSPPYFNAPFDYPNLFPSYDSYLAMMQRVAKEIWRVLVSGRIVCIVCDDVLVDGIRYPIVADITRIFIETGFRYRERILWLKPEGYIRISRRSGVILQHPYPLYFYPDNVQESILLFQKGKFDYRSISSEMREASRIDVGEFQRQKWYLNVWQITNVLPMHGQLEEGIAAFPEELARRLILLFSHKGEVVLDPFLGSGTTMKVARILGRSCIGYEIDAELLPVIRAKVGIDNASLLDDATFEVVVRKDAQKLRTWLSEQVKQRRSSARNAKGKATKPSL
ncbi:MAG: site-specific DNA-methyltransferase [Chloroflexota bacterium]